MHLGSPPLGRSAAIEAKGFRPSELIEEQPVSRFEPVHADASVACLHRLVAIPHLERLFLALRERIRVCTSGPYWGKLQVCRENILGGIFWFTECMKLAVG